MKFNARKVIAYVFIVATSIFLIAIVVYLFIDQRSSLNIWLSSIFVVAAVSGFTTYALAKKTSDNFKLAIDHSAEQILITDADGTVIYANRATEQTTGYAIEEVINKKVGTIWSAPMPKEFYENLWKTIKIDKKEFTGELKNRRKNGQLYDAELKIVPVLSNKNDVLFFIGIERDISNEKEISRAKSEFVALASHQLRTPPSIIRWSIEMLQAGTLGPLNENQEKYLAEIEKANRRMMGAINTLLNISRIEMGTFSISPKATNINSIIDETIKELELWFNRKAHIKKSCDASLENMTTDPGILTIIVDNLLSNAFKYSLHENVQIEIVAKEENGAFILSVKDNGISILPKDRDKIFQKLFRADNAVVAYPDGTGLGLYMVKKIVEEGLGGKIWFDSEENIGTTFYVSIPTSSMKEKIGSTNLITAKDKFL